MRSPFSSQITVFFSEEKFKCSNKRGDPTDISQSKIWRAAIMKTWGSLIMKNVLSLANGWKMFWEGLHWSKKPQERHSDRLNIGNSFVCPDNLWSVMYFYSKTGCKGIIFQKTYYPSGRTSVAFIKHYGLWNSSVSPEYFGAIPAEGCTVDQESTAAWGRRKMLDIPRGRTEY